MDAHRVKRISKKLSYVLRHNPSDIGLELDPAGWAAVDVLLDALQRDGSEITFDELAFVVSTNDKKRFSFDGSLQRIRANQGHSIEVDLGYEQSAPPELLFHGTVDRFLASIRTQGLQKQSRHHVHLSEHRETAIAVGKRRGRPVILVIDSQRMHVDGVKFFVTPNRVWLTDMVHPRYIEWPD